MSTSGAGHGAGSERSGRSTSRATLPSTVTEGSLLWSPSPERRAHSNMARYMRWLREERGLGFERYDELWRWSTSDLEAFWQSIADYFDVGELAGADSVLSSRAMPGTRWFEGRTLNYAERALRRRDEHPALVHRIETGPATTVRYSELADGVARARAGLSRLGVRRGDRVAALLPNGPEAVVVLLAAASLGAITSTCSPELGAEAVLARFAQIEPTVLVAVERYVHGGRSWDRRTELETIRRGLGGLAALVVVEREGGGDAPRARASEPHAVASSPQTDGRSAPTMSWADLLSEWQPLEFERVPFDHPLWILYSSGTTGLPKPIVHGHGGILLEHLKAVSLHCDIGPSDRFFWYTTTGWMMWNFLVGGLLCGSTIILHEGSPSHPDLGALWRMAAEERVSYFGTSAPFIHACHKAGLAPGVSGDLSVLRAVGSTGAPLSVEGFAWIYREVGADLLLGSVSGGTDVCTAFLLSCPLLPVHAGELQCAGLGCAVSSFDPQGKPLATELGELVITAPMPSMPVGFWNDADGHRYREAYFAHFDGVWRHGDWVRFNPSGGAVVEGRSDATLNRGGVRIGTSELYSVVERLPFVADSLVVDTGSLSQPSTLWLFVVPAEGETIGPDEILRAREAIRRDLSPRHVPDVVEPVRAIPRTINGKKLEVPVKRILMGEAAHRVAHRASMADPRALDDFVALARARRDAGR